MTFLGFMVEYMMRNLLSIAITQIAKKTYTNESIISGDVCPADNETIIDDNDDLGNTNGDGFYEWSESLQGIILSSFYWGYIVTHIPGGVLVERLGGKVLLLAGIVATSVLTCLTPVSITLGGPYLLIGNRVVMGLCQGFIYAAVFGLLSTWIPLRERTTLGVFVLSGIQVSPDKDDEILNKIYFDSSVQFFHTTCQELYFKISMAGSGPSICTAFLEFCGVFYS